MTDEDRINEAKNAATRVKEKKRELPVLPENSVQARLKDVAQRPDEDKQRKDAEKARKAELKKMPKEERKVEEAKDKLEKAKKKLEEAKKSKNDKKIEKAKKEVEKAKKDLAKAKKKLDKLNMAQVAKRERDAAKGIKDANDSISKNPKSKEKEKKKKENEKDNTSSKDAQKAKLAEHIKLPSGLQIRQDGPNYVLVSQGKDGKEQTTPINDIMNEIDKYNKSVDAKNAATLAQSNVQKGVDDKAKGMKPDGQGLPTNGVTGNVQLKGDSQSLPTIPASQQAEAENIVKNIGGDRIKPEDVKEVAKTAMELSKLDLLKDPHAIEKLKEREEKNKDKEKARIQQLQHEGAVRS